MAGSRPQPVLTPPRSRCAKFSLLFHCISASGFTPGPSPVFSCDHKRIQVQPQSELLNTFSSTNFRNAWPSNRWSAVLPAVTPRPLPLLAHRQQNEGKTTIKHGMVTRNSGKTAFDRFRTFVARMQQKEAVPHRDAHCRVCVVKRGPQSHAMH